MISRMKKALQQYPRQFWVVVFLLMLAWTFHSMLWPFLMIYVSQKLNTSLTAVAGMLTVNAIAGLVTTFLGGAIADKLGRKWVMAFSLLLCAVSWYLFQLATTTALFIALMALNGATTPLYRLAADAMMADLLPPDQRIEAYSILRMGNNLGVALGPTLGGFLAAVSYPLAFSVAGIGMLACGILTIILSRETMPARKATPESTQKVKMGGYGRVFRDRSFVFLIVSYLCSRLASATIWLMLGVYVKTNFGMSERLYGFIPMTNAVMVILMQVLITSQVKKQNANWMMALGSAFYGVAVLGVAFATGFWGFWLCMVVATIGEMVLVPTSTTVAARLAPEDMRGRYMGIYTVTAALGSGFGPLLGGYLSDTFSPLYTWYGGGAAGFLGAIAFMLGALFKMRRTHKLNTISD
jgi:MFS family permease